MHAAVAQKLAPAFGGVVEDAFMTMKWTEEKKLMVRIWMLAGVV